MIRKSALVSVSAFLTFFASTASAHPSPNILQAGGAKGDRVALTGVEYKRESSVGVYRGRTKLLGDTPVRADNAHQEIEITLLSRGDTCQKPARLRTQGFYSGTGKTYSFTQGFYSGQRIVRR